MLHACYSQSDESKVNLNGQSIKPVYTLTKTKRVDIVWAAFLCDSN